MENLNENVYIPKLWFTSDQHFGSERALKLSRRPFVTVEEMDNTIIDNFNSNVCEDDIVFHLGDFGNFDRLKELNCKNQYLIIGNYESEEIANNFDRDFISYNEYLKEKGFKDVFKSYVMSIDTHPTLKTINLVHKPEDCIKLSPAVKFNLFGHIHGRQMIKRYGIDVGVDAHHFYPITIDTVKFYYDAIMNHYDSNVFE